MALLPTPVAPIVSGPEQCDDGKLAGAYGGCAKGCVLGPRCGDKIVQKDAGEQCDDGNHKNLDGCSAVCKIEAPKCSAVCKIEAPK